MHDNDTEARNRHTPGNTLGSRKGLDDEHASGRDRKDSRDAKRESNIVRPESEKDTGQAPPEDIDGGPSTEGVDFGGEVSAEERARREKQLADTDEGF